MKFRMSGGWWLAICSTIYLIAGMIAIFVYHQSGDGNFTIMYIQMVWIFVTSLPLWINPVARFCNMQLPWGK